MFKNASNNTRLRHLISLTVAPNVKLTEKYDGERASEWERSAKRHSFYCE